MKLASLVLAGSIAVAALSAEAFSKTNKMNKYEARLHQKSTVVVEEEAGGLGKHYLLTVAGVRVCRVDGAGRGYPGERDVFSRTSFTLTTLDDVVLASEKGCLPFFPVEKAVALTDRDGELRGYLGKERWQDVYSDGMIFHLYDQQRKEVGVSPKLHWLSLGSHAITDEKGKAEYEIREQVRLFGAHTYTITVLNRDSEIPVEWVILLVCIEDAIADAHKK